MTEVRIANRIIVTTVAIAAVDSSKKLSDIMFVLISISKLEKNSNSIII